MSVLVAIALFFLFSCQSETKKDLAEDSEVALPFERQTLVGKNSEPILHNGVLYYISSGRSKHDSSDIYALSSKGEKRITYQNAPIKGLAISGDTLIYASAYKSRLRRFESLENPEEFDLMESTLSGNRRQSHTLKKAPQKNFAIKSLEKVAYLTSHNGQPQLIVENLSKRKKTFRVAPIKGKVITHPFWIEDNLSWVERDNSLLSSQIVKTASQKKEDTEILFSVPGKIEKAHWTDIGLFYSVRAPGAESSELHFWKEGCIKKILSTGVGQVAIDSENKILYFDKVDDQQIYKYQWDEPLCEAPSLNQEAG